MKIILIKLITFYQKLTKYKKPNCKFYPTCSVYAKEAIEKYGSYKGTIMALRRILRCTPWAEAKIDPVK
jgi:putative membrane protein insertion efficiency factor